MINISIVTPVFKSESCIYELYSRLKAVLLELKVQYEIIFVDDGSPDNSWELIENLSGRDDGVIGIKLSRNFGQHNAIIAGLEQSKGDYIVVMDCDLQDSPEAIPKLYNIARQGFDIVFVRRILRQDKFFKRLSSKLFYLIFSFLTRTSNDPGIANFGIYSRQVIDSVLKFRERIKNFPLFVKWVGFKISALDYPHSERFGGESSYSFIKLFKLAANSIISYTNRPLYISVGAGCAISFVSLIFGAWMIIRYFIYGISITGWTSLMVSIYFLSGIILSSIGILGIYIGKIFEEVKSRPVYVVEKKIINKIH